MTQLSQEMLMDREFFMTDATKIAWIFFSHIRGCGGNRTNPSAYEFATAFTLASIIFLQLINFQIVNQTKTNLCFFFCLLHRKLQKKEYKMKIILIIVLSLTCLVAMKMMILSKKLVSKQPIFYRKVLLLI